MRDLDITQAIRNALPVDSFLFNPSLALVTGDTYMLTVRSYLNDTTKKLDDNPNNSKNLQHPWHSSWKGGHDLTYVLPVVIVGDNIQPITGKYPFIIEAQDTRIFRFIQVGEWIMYILTYNRSYSNREDLIIKGGDKCDDYCYIIDWSLLLVNINTLEYRHILSDSPLCPNISEQVDKNWSFWAIHKDDIYSLIVSYKLTPIHTAFTVKLDDIVGGKLVASELCEMITERPKDQTNFFDRLELYHDRNLIVSLSTPAYKIGKEYQAVGHIKVKLSYLRKNPRGNLLDFVEKHLDGKYLHNMYVYFMYIYRFKTVNGDSSEYLDNTSNKIEVGKNKRLVAKITKVSPAFIIDSNYLINFPSGMVVNEKDTIISYGDGDRTSHLLYLSNNKVNELLEPIDDLTPHNYKFKVYPTKIITAL